ncbi:hypothetical protein HOO68_02755 [Candidatus Gracilibacteria bacterium]|nr:hypothetical protein [Candidatus Gracilibacteria bacterium]
MKKIFIVPVLLFTISSCTLGGNNKDSSFSDLYTASTHSSIMAFDELSSSLGINRHESINGAIHSNVSVPGILSGSLSSEYVGLIDGRNSESIFKNVQLFFTSLVSSGSLSADEFGVMSHGGESYISYKNLTDVGVMSDDIKQVLKKYEGTWMNIMSKSQEDMSSEELMGYNIGKNLVTKSLDDIEKYITEYPVWKDTADLGMSGSVHYWAVEIHRENIVSLLKKLTLDLSGSGMTNENIADMEKSLGLLSFSGKLGFEPSNPKISLLEGALSASGKLIANVVVSKDENGGIIKLSNPTEKTDVSIVYGKKESKYSFDISVKQSELEMGRVNAYIEKVDGKFRELSLEASAQGMTVSLKHTLEGGKFIGKLSAIVGSLDWSGDAENGKLKSLKMDGTAPFGSLSVNLVPNETDGMIRGPILLKAGEETLFSANFGLEIAPEKFAMMLDVISDMTPAHIDLDITAKASSSDKKIVAPSNIKSLQDLIKEIEALTPAVPEFSEVDTTELPEMSGDPIGNVGLPQ